MSFIGVCHCLCHQEGGAEGSDLNSGGDAVGMHVPEEENKQIF